MLKIVFPTTSFDLLFCRKVRIGKDVKAQFTLVSLQIGVILLHINFSHYYEENRSLHLYIAVPISHFI